MDLKLHERTAVPLSLDALLDLLEFYQCGAEPRMSPPLALGWDIYRQWPSEGFAVWRDLMLEYEPPLLATELLDGDQRQAVTLDQYEAALVEQWALYAREKHWLDQLIVDVMHSERERGYEPCGDAWDATEAILNDLAAKCGVKRAAFQAEEDAREERRCKRLDRYYDLDDAGYAKWIAEDRPYSDAKKIERWTDRRFREHLEKATMPVVPFSGPIPPAPARVPEAATKAATPDLITSSEKFMADFEAPEYLIDGILQRRYFYSLTAQTGIGKTAVALRWAAHVITGRPLGTVEVEKGAVLYLAGENPSDVQARWIGLAREMGFDPAQEHMHFLVGAMDFRDVANRIGAEVLAKGLQFALVVIDTAAAYNFGDDENSNTQMGQYARLLRELTKAPGGPCVVVLCHPTKNADENNLQPRGGGAFIAEVDGNMGVQKANGHLAVSAQGKFRGSPDWTLRYELEVIRDHPKLRDTKGRFIPTVVARPVADGVAAAMESRAGADTEAMLAAISKAPASRATELARALGWTYGAKAEPNVNKANRALKLLADDKLAVDRLGTWKATDAGGKYLNELDAKRAIKLTPDLRPAFPLPRS